MNKYVTKRICKFFEDNPEIFNVCLEQLDGCNGCLDGERCYNMDEFDEICFGLTSTEIAFKIYYGFDADSYTTDSFGNRTYTEFNPNRKYVSYNGVGNFISTDIKDYRILLNDDIIEQMDKYRDDIDEICENDDLLELFNELD